MGITWLLIACNKNIFILLFHVFLYIESESDIHFVRSLPVFELKGRLGYVIQ